MFAWNDKTGDFQCVREIRFIVISNKAKFSSPILVYVYCAKVQNTNIFFYKYVKELKIKSYFKFHNRPNISLGYYLALSNTKRVFVWV